MSELRAKMDRARLQVTRNLIYMLHAQANMVEDWSADDSNPNVSGYLRNGLTDMVLEMEREVFDAGVDWGKRMSHG